ncbi:MAG: O-antigen ligase family protein [Rhizobiaceae bacterium]
MSNIASPRRTDFAGVAEAEALKARIAAVIASLILAVLLISFRPFTPMSPTFESGGTGGDAVNQLGFGSLGALSLFAIFAFVDRRVASALLSPWWLLLLAFLALSVLDATDPPSAMRAAMFTVIAIFGICAVLTLPRDADSFSTVIAWGGFAVVGLSYVGLVVFPNEAKHLADSIEPQHAGFWRGVFTHKNVAGPVMACLGFGGIYLWRRGWRWSGGGLFLLAMIFMSHTGSKTTLGLVPLAVLPVILPGLIGMRFLTPLFFILSMIIMGLATLGIVFIDPLKQLAAQLAPDLTYTGRVSLWEFSGEMIMKKPWTGYGFESFWDTPTVYNVDQPFDRAWDIRGIVHGHNSYLDLAVYMGLPALAFAVVTFLLVPMKDFLRIPRLRENVLLADFFMMILCFTALNAWLESFFFHRADPVWLMFVMAIIGLRLVARFPVKSQR